MLNGTSSLVAHRAQNAGLILLSLILLPLDTMILTGSLLVRLIFHDEVSKSRSAARDQAGFRPRTVLVTGVGMTKGLVLSRLFYQAGHDVIGADFEPSGSLTRVSGRVSRSLTRFYRLDRPDGTETEKGASARYIQSLLEIIAHEKVDLWVSCSGVASAVDDGMAKEVVEARTPCRAVQFDVKTTQTLHEKHRFIQYTRNIGLTVPDTHEITASADVEKILEHAPAGRKYILKPVGVDDSVRGDMTLLPLPVDERSAGRGSSSFSAADTNIANTVTDTNTSRHIARLTQRTRISPESPWILQQFIKGREYCTHSLVVRGQVSAFVACPSSELLMHYEALPANSPLSTAMLEFTRQFSASYGYGSDFTGHLSFDFIVEDDGVEKAENVNWDSNRSESGDGNANRNANRNMNVNGNGNESPEKSFVLYPIECNPRAHTAVALFNGTTELVDKYLSLLDPPTTNTTRVKNDLNTTITPAKNDSTTRITPAKGSDDLSSNSIGYSHDHDHDHDPATITPTKNDEYHPAVTSRVIVVTPTKNDKYYWIGHDLVTMLILPLRSVATLDCWSDDDSTILSRVKTVRNHYATFIIHLLDPTWRDGTYEAWDPFPWWWLYHVYWPLRFLACIWTGQKWSRMNVSTTKIFQC